MGSRDVDVNGGVHFLLITLAFLFVDYIIIWFNSSIVHRVLLRTSSYRILQSPTFCEYPLTER